MPKRRGKNPRRAAPQGRDEVPAHRLRPKRLQPRTFNAPNPPREVISFLPKEKLFKLLLDMAIDERCSVSKIVNDLLCGGLDIPEEER